MKIILNANETVLSILKRFVKTADCTRWLQYCVHTQVDDGVLVLNNLTREMILLTPEEYNRFTELDYLKKHLFVVPEETKDKEYADFLKWMLAVRQPKAKEITAYTIFTTTDCNARCFYCFELGRSRVPMSCETAEKVVEYIKAHCGGKDVRLGWFGGEPLYNQSAIEIICEGLRKANISFNSRMISNGYLFDDDTVQKAVNDWNLKKVQITLDGTEQIYNKVKAFIYTDGNPYEIVMHNIGRLLDAGIFVSIRLNMDLHNAEDLLTLAQEIAQRFAGKRGLRVYAHHLYKAGTPDAELHSDEEWTLRDAAMDRLTSCLDHNKLLPRPGVPDQIKLNHCMADSGKAVTILPNGEIGLCEHHTEDEFIGHIDEESFDPAAVASWKERIPEIPECADCFYFLDCIKLKKCSSGSVCYPRFREAKLKDTRSAMENEYRKWQTKSEQDEIDEADFC